MFCATPVCPVSSMMIFFSFSRNFHAFHPLWHHIRFQSTPNRPLLSSVTSQALSCNSHFDQLITTSQFILSKPHSHVLSIVRSQAVSLQAPLILNDVTSWIVTSQAMLQNCRLFCPLWHHKPCFFLIWHHGLCAKLLFLSSTMTSQIPSSLQPPFGPSCSPWHHHHHHRWWDSFCL